MLYKQPNIDFSSQYMTPEVKDGPLGDVWNSAREASHSSYEILSEHNNESAVYQSHIDKVSKLTGTTLTNPAKRWGAFDDGFDDDKNDFYKFYDQHKADGGGLWYNEAIDKFYRDKFERQLRDLADKHPEHSQAIVPEVAFKAQGYQRAQDKEQAEQEAWDAAPAGVGRWSAWLGGGLHAAAEDPVTWATAPIGLQGKAAWGAKGLATAFLKTGATNAAVEAGLQPWIQEYRKKAGLAYGVNQAAMAVGAAFLFGGAIDTTFRGTWRAGRHFSGYEPVLDVKGHVTAYRKPGATAPDLPISTVRAAAGSDIEALRTVAKHSGADEDPAVRGHLRALEVEQVTTARKPVEGITDVDHIDFTTPDRKARSIA